MYYLAASGMCLAALFGSFIYENHRLKKEEQDQKEILKKIHKEI